MALNILFAAGPGEWEVWRPHLDTALRKAGLDVTLRPLPDLAPDEVDYILYAPDSSLQDFAPFTRLKAVLNLWAGVEDVITNPTLRVPLARMVDPGLERGMVEWVCTHVLRHHLGIDAHIRNPDHRWSPHVPPLATDRPVTMLGLGELGSAAARALSDFGFPVTGWSRSAKAIPGISCTHGQLGLVQALELAQIVVLLLPATARTENILNAETLAMLPKGAVILNPGRGTLIDDDALLAALDRGHIAHATLDTFRSEPLPADHPYWQHPQVTVTPHIASTTRPETASEVLAGNIARSEAGRPLLDLVDPAQGY
ncbi:2-hydroxyacid dehydrogenase [Pontibaca methylaminivorans]|uniref:Glyoxylate/hydroxypyruvate reductase A n=1 Tax=Pontibaca methylaminivorans TaxID=515897 RepID=A0A1R3WXH7_9RHOB|nr:glyoxylate/hydroxypyruvate reductase A [Pontibaca methylaminivorans]SIT82964.1 glyoxylate/hydroxypyruvate reductase A [Pontibaca methylaminivorans]